MKCSMAFGLGALALTAVIPARADAARVSVAAINPCGNQPAKAGDLCLYGATFTAAPGEANRVTVSHESGKVRFTDSAAAVTAESPCTQDGPNAAVCPLEYGVKVSAGDGDDEVGNTIPIEVEPFSGFHIIDVRGGEGADRLTGGALKDSLDGGPGDDEITGGGGPDALTGGPGRDRVAGGSGADELKEGETASDPAAEPDALDGGEDFDMVTYARRKSGVTVDLSRAVPQGAPGEGDVVTNVEGARGGEGPDRLVGTDAAQAFAGGKGDDVISAGGGDDVVDSGTGRDRVDGGAGDDRIYLGAFKGETDVAACGAGEDRVSGATGGSGKDPLLERDCEMGVDMASSSADRFRPYPVRIRGGVATFRLACPAERGLCRGKLRLIRADGGAAAVLGTGRTNGKGGSRISVRVSLTEKAQRLAARDLGVVTRVTYAGCSCSWRIRLKT